MEYQLRPLGKTCAATGQELVPGSLCHSVVVEKGEELVRLDFSEAGWNGPPENAIAQWKNYVPLPVQSKRNLLDTDALMNYFEQLTEESNPAFENMRYVLALLLDRKRRLRIEATRLDGETEVLQLTSTVGEGTYEVRDPQLSDEEIAQLQERLNAHLMAEGSSE